MTSSISIAVKGESVLAALTGARERLFLRLKTEVTRLSIKLQAKTKEKLSGNVLHVRSGTLRRSINRTVEADGEKISAEVGTNVVYAAIHEYGFNGVVNVRAHTRRTSAQLSVKKSKQVPKAEGETTVREHTRHMVMPERSYLRSSLREMQDEIKIDLKKAAREAVREGLKK